VEVAAAAQTAETLIGETVKVAAVVPKEAEAEAIDFLPVDDCYQVFDLQPDKDDPPWLDGW
jgi:streptogramin lyase